MVAQWYPPNFYPVIVAGTTWHWELPPFIDTATGGWFNWTAEPGRWLLEADLKDRHGQLIARFASAGTRDGDIVGDADGLVSFDMVAASTELLPITRTYINSTDPRVAAWRHRAPLFFDLVVVDTAAGVPTSWVLAAGFVTVQQSLTA